MTVTFPETPSLLAEICVLPGLMAVTNPDDDTVATALALELHVTVRVNAAPVPSRGVAVSCVVVPATSDGLAGVTVSVTTDGGGDGGGGSVGGDAGSLPPHATSARSEIVVTCRRARSRGNRMLGIAEGGGRARHRPAVTRFLLSTRKPGLSRAHTSPSLDS